MFLVVGTVRLRSTSSFAIPQQLTPKLHTYFTCTFVYSLEQADSVCARVRR